MKRHLNSATRQNYNDDSMAYHIGLVQILLTFPKRSLVARISHPTEI